MGFQFAEDGTPLSLWVCQLLWNSPDSACLRSPLLNSFFASLVCLSLGHLSSSPLPPSNNSLVFPTNLRSRSISFTSCGPWSASLSTSSHSSSLSFERSKTGGPLAISSLEPLSTLEDRSFSSRSVLRYVTQSSITSMACSSLPFVFC